MVVKTYKLGEIELVITKNEKGLYNAIRMTNDNQSQFVSDLTYDDADDTFLYWLDALEGNDK